VSSLSSWELATDIAAVTTAQILYRLFLLTTCRSVINDTEDETTIDTIRLLSDNKMFFGQQAILLLLNS